MLETFLSIAVFGSFIWWLIITTVLLIFLFTSEIEGNNIIPFFSIILYFVILYFWSNKDIDILFNWINIISYIGIGLLYAIIKTYFLGNKVKKDIKKYLSEEKSWIKNDDDAKKYKNNTINDFKTGLKDNIFRWWLFWPISLIVWLFKDLIKDIWNFIYKYTHKLFEKIFMLGIGNSDNIK